nr:putative ring-type e3 ubiquitin transferase c3h69 [Quercus suber]
MSGRGVTKLVELLLENLQLRVLWTCFMKWFMSLLSLKVHHAYRDGRLEEVVLRHLGSEDGETVIAKNIRLSEFLGNMRIRISNDMEKSCATSIAEFFSNASVALQLFLRFACWRGPEHGVLGMLYYLSRTAIASLMAWVDPPEMASLTSFTLASTFSLSS